MSLKVRVVSAKDLPNIEAPFSKSDPRCILTFREKEERTAVISSQLAPTWDETKEWVLDSPLSTKDVLEIGVYDYEPGGWHRPLGFLDLSLWQLVQSKKMTVDKQLVAKKKVGMRVKPKNASIQLELTYNPPSKIDHPVGDGHVAGREEDKSTTVTDVGSGEEEERVDTTTGGLTIAGVQAKRKARTHKLANRPMDFQVQVHVIEGRKLEGVQLNPLVKVACGDEIKGTSSRKATSNPFFDEMLFFNFHEYPTEMLDRLVDIKVLDAKRNEMLIGSFKFDLHMVYNEPGHCFQHKWLLLTNPKESGEAVKGYLKISIVVIAPGADSKSLSHYIDPEDVDIESNLLRPSGMQLQPAILTIKIYRAEHLPQMDPAYFEKVKKFFHVGKVQQDPVDPYCTVSYGGHKAMTDVVMNDTYPHWNYEVNMAVRFPSMCERIQFQVMDKDIASWDDYVGTCFLDMSQISAFGKDGFLPTFGPCFINIYGSPQDYTQLPDKYDNLNKGKIEGVAYRGRVLVEVSLSMSSTQGPTEGKEQNFIINEQRLAPLLRKKKFRLYAVFFSATMVNPANESVKFEVSIGKYGTKLDKRESQVAVNSITPKKTPVHYGHSYYFIPWRNQKPCLVVDSEWEDCIWRIETQNMLLRVANKLEERMNKAEKMMRQNSKEAEDELRAALRDFDQDIESLPPELPKEGYTQLDKRMRKYRKKELDSLRHATSVMSSSDCTLNEKLEKCEEIVAALRELAVEPQNCIPDVIIWMLAGGKRIACHRIPSNLLMYCGVGSQTRGSKCGITQTIFLTPPAVEDTEEENNMAQLQVLLWLGPEEESSHWMDELLKNDRNVKDKVAYVAETYEYQTYIGLAGIGTWTEKLAKGNIKETKKAYEHPPEGWEWEDEWFKSPELSINFDPEIGQSEWEEEVFENQSRMTGFNKWSQKSSWMNVQGEKLFRYDGKKKLEMTRDDIRCPEGWKWKETEWTVDMRRVVDIDGWEYSIRPDLGNWGPSESIFHLSRRRRWTRVRMRSEDAETIDSVRKTSYEEEGWEYTSPGSNNYHVTEHTLDLFRRRRWLRKLKMKPDNKGQQPIFPFDDKKKLARMYLSYGESDLKYYQLRAYLYQARDVYGSDRTGLSDPYILVSFSRYSASSHKDYNTVSPKWDQTIMIKNIEMFGDDSAIHDYPPMIVAELYDKDEIGADEYLGRVECFPSVGETPRLVWYDITRYNKPAGQLLAAFELKIEDHEIPDWPTELDKHGREYFIVPDGIRPVSAEMQVEVLCWGVRDMKNYQVLPVNNPFVEVECGSTLTKSEPIRDASKNPNFPDKQRIVTFKAMIPQEELYAPPLNIHVYDKRIFGLTPLIGSYSTPVHKYLQPKKARKKRTKVEGTEPVTVRDHIAITMDPPTHASSSKETVYDWWSKYYLSIGQKRRVQKGYEEDGLDQLEVYQNELEEEYDFSDFVDTFPLFRGKGSRVLEEDSNQVAGYLKGAVKIYPISDIPSSPFSKFPSSEPTDVVVRVYIVEGINLQPKDLDQKSDPYIKVSVGKHTIDDRDCYIPGDLNPVFGRMYELNATLPLNNKLTITVMDWDRLTADDTIGSTEIDLEDRFFTPQRARCGLPQSYSIRQWRDQESPEDILNKYCTARGLPLPEWGPRITDSVKVDGVITELDEHEKPASVPGEQLVSLETLPQTGMVALQRLALKALHKTQELVPEHVETRKLYNPQSPGIPQGELRMWVDIFNKHGPIPNPVDISPRKPQKYVLRVVVYNVKDVKEFADENIFGEGMNDLYVEGWLRREEESQKTDVHYRSMDGEGNFNWRLVFPFEYSPFDKMTVVKQKEHFYSLTLTEHNIPGAPQLTLRVQDNDFFSSDDYLGSIDLDLGCMPHPQKVARNCTVRRQLFEDQGGRADRSKGIDLFKRKRMKGWWPVTMKNRVGNIIQNGKLELEIEVLTEEEATEKPAGKARNEPNTNPHLEKPKRPATSFLWFTSPWKSFKFLVWRRYRCYIITAAVLLLVGFILMIALGVFAFTAPIAIMVTLIGIAL